MYPPISFLHVNIQYAAYDKKSLSDVGKVVPTASSGVVPLDLPQPVHYQEEDEPKAEHTKPSGESEAVQQKPTGAVGQMRFEEVVYRDEHGNILDDEALAKLVAEQGDNIEFKTIYETKTKTLLPGEEPPPGAKRIPVGDEKVDVPVYPEGQNPETGPADDGGEKKAYRT
jgi:dolichyl-phosphate-mannose-protein mannosyltransferase